MIKSELCELSCYKLLCFCASSHCIAFKHPVKHEYMWSLRENGETWCDAAQVDLHKKTHFTHSNITSGYKCWACGYSFYRFPQEEEQLQHWISSMQTAAGWRPSESALLCSDHFTPDCFQTSGRLNSYAVPSVFQPTVSHSVYLFIRHRLFNEYLIIPFIQICQIIFWLLVCLILLFLNFSSIRHCRFYLTLDLDSLAWIFNEEFDYVQSVTSKLNNKYNIYV